MLICRFDRLSKYAEIVSRFEFLLALREYPSSHPSVMPNTSEEVQVPCLIPYATVYTPHQVTPPNALMYHASSLNNPEDSAFGSLASISGVLQCQLAL